MSERARSSDVAGTGPSPQPDGSRDGGKACPTDLSITCPTCGTAMQPEHAHYRCTRCGYRDSCCM